MPMSLGVSKAGVGGKIGFFGTGLDVGGDSFSLANVVLSPVVRGLFSIWSVADEGVTGGWIIGPVTER